MVFIMSILNMDKRGSLFYKTDMTPEKFCGWLNEWETPNRTAFAVRKSGGNEITYQYQQIIFHFFGDVRSLVSKFLVEKRDGGLKMTVIFRKPLLAFPAIITAWLIFVFGTTLGFAVSSEKGVALDLIVLGVAAFIIAALLWFLVMFQARFSIRILKRHILRREQMDLKKFYGQK
jgi:hypothetical protein